MEAFPITWVLTAIPLIALALNLLFPRSQLLKVLALLFLGGAIFVHAVLSCVPLIRAIAHHQRYGTPVLTPFMWSVIEVGTFDIALGLALGMVFAVLPVDVLLRVLRRLRHDSA
jgi:hypothetical protein